MTKDLFADEAEEDQVGLKVNTGYAKKYGKWKRKEELSHLKDLYGDELDDEDSNDEVEDEDGRLLDRDLDYKLFKTLMMVRAGDESVYNKESRFFDDEDFPTFKEEQASIKASEKPKKPFTLKDMERERIMSGKTLDDEDTDEEREMDERLKEGEMTKSANTEAELMQSLKSALATVAGEDKVTTPNDDFLEVKEKTKKEKDQEEEDYQTWLSQNLIRETGKKEAVQKAMDTSKMDDDDRFLFNYAFNQGWKSKDGETVLDLGFDPDAEADFDDKAEEFETTYNFRFEEPGAGQVNSYAGQIDGSLRTSESKRKAKRELAKKKQEVIKVKRDQELSRLKHLKKQEIVDRLLRIQSIAGIDKVDEDAFDFEGDWDEEEYEKQKAKLFNDQYENRKEDDLSFLDADEQDLLQVDGVANNSDHSLNGANDSQEDEIQTPKALLKVSNDEKLVDSKGPLDVPLSDKPKMMDKSLKASKAQRKKALQELEEDPRFMASLAEIDLQPLLDRIDKMPVKFKYGKVKPVTYGLRPDEVLDVEEIDLKRHMGPKKLAPYRSSEKQEKDEQKATGFITLKKFREKIAETRRLRDAGELEDDQPSKKSSKTKKRNRESEKPDGEIDLDAGRLSSYGQSGSAKRQRT